MNVPQVRIVLKHCLKVYHCTHQPYDPLKMACIDCQSWRIDIEKFSPEGLLELRQSKYICWKLMCGWTLTEDGKHLYNALRGNYRVTRKRVKPPID